MSFLVSTTGPRATTGNVTCANHKPVSTLSEPLKIWLKLVSDNAGASAENFICLKRLEDSLPVAEDNLLPEVAEILTIVREVTESHVFNKALGRKVKQALMQP